MHGIPHHSPFSLSTTCSSKIPSKVCLFYSEFQEFQCPQAASRVISRILEEREASKRSGLIRSLFQRAYLYLSAWYLDQPTVHTIVLDRLLNLTNLFIHFVKLSKLDAQNMESNKRTRLEQITTRDYNEPPTAKLASEKLREKKQASADTSTLEQLSQLLASIFEQVLTIDQVAVKSGKPARQTHRSVLALNQADFRKLFGNNRRFEDPNIDKPTSSNASTFFERMSSMLKTIVNQRNEAAPSSQTTAAAAAIRNLSSARAIIQAKLLFDLVWNWSSRFIVIVTLESLRLLKLVSELYNVSVLISKEVAQKKPVKTRRVSSCSFVSCKETSSPKQSAYFTAITNS